ncbi:MAG: ATP-dependent Clp protease proteolytic subunit [Desulfurococcales archaeon]|nr:ATP-dependent Clp protease proteolytic subunit [Desulfurococcales archaeon]
MNTDPFNTLIWFLFWLLLLLPIISPTYSYQRLKAARMKLLQIMERKYGYRFVTLIHRQEKIGMLGIPIYRFIDVDDSEAVIRAIRQTPREQPIALILHTPGGMVLAAAQIAMALKRHPSKKIVIVPHYAMSGGTLIALAADEIWMDPNAVLGPLDPQLGVEQGFYAPAPSIVKVANLKGKDASDKLLLMADVAEKAMSEVKEMIVNLVEDRLGREKAEEIADILTSGKWTHDYPITFYEARKLGLPVKDEIPEEVYQLMDLYPQAPINRPGVDYVPHPIIPHHPSPRGNTK